MQITDCWSWKESFHRLFSPQPSFVIQSGSCRAGPVGMWSVSYPEWQGRMACFVTGLLIWYPDCRLVPSLLEHVLGTQHQIFFLWPLILSLLSGGSWLNLPVLLVGIYSWLGELQIHWETLSQKIRSTEESTCHWSLASSYIHTRTFMHIPAHIHTLYISTSKSSALVQPHAGRAENLISWMFQ